jgi:hypothetical protein
MERVALLTLVFRTKEGEDKRKAMALLVKVYEVETKAEAEQMKGSIMQLIDEINFEVLASKQPITTYDGNIIGSCGN